MGGNGSGGVFRQQLLESVHGKTDWWDVEHKERVLLNSMNLPVFLEQLCSHKRHIKLENLRSLNLANNKLKKFGFMFELSQSQCSVEELERISTTSSSRVSKSRMVSYFTKKKEFSISN